MKESWRSKEICAVQFTDRELEANVRDLKAKVRELEAKVRELEAKCEALAEEAASASWCAAEAASYNAKDNFKRCKTIMS